MDNNTNKIDQPDDAPDFDRLKNEIMQRERRTLVKQRIGWLLVMGTAIWLVYYLV